MDPFWITNKSRDGFFFKNKEVELDVITENAFDKVEYVVDVPNPTDLVKIRTREDSKSRAILIRSIAYDNIQKTLLKPSQEIKMIIQEQMAAKSTRVSGASISLESRRNPDTTFGLHNTSEVRAEARAVQAAKELKKMLEQKKAKVKEMKAGELTIKKTESFGHVANIIKGIVPGGELKKELL